MAGASGEELDVGGGAVAVEAEAGELSAGGGGGEGEEGEVCGDEGEVGGAGGEAEAERDVLRRSGEGPLFLPFCGGGGG